MLVDEAAPTEFEGARTDAPTYVEWNEGTAQAGGEPNADIDVAESEPEFADSQSREEPSRPEDPWPKTE